MIQFFSAAFLMWPDPALTELHAQSLVNGIVDRIKAAVG